MALLSLPRRTRIARFSDRMPHPDLADLVELVDAAVEVGTKRRPIPRAARRRPRRRRTAGMMLLVAVVGATVLAYRWWRARERATAEADLVELADRAEGAPMAPPSVFPAAQPTPVPQPAASAVESPTHATAPVELQHEVSRAPGVTSSAVEPSPAPDAPASQTEASVSSETPAPELSVGSSEPSPTDQWQATARREPREASSRGAAGVWTPSTQSRRPQGAAAPAHPRWGVSRGPSSGTPLMPSVRPTIPSRPHPHLPR